MSFRPSNGHSFGMPGTGKVFFRIILQEKKQLSLPVKFVRKYGDELLSVAKLMMPNGLVWEVQLIKELKDNHIIMFLNEMFEYYSICLGHCLIFKYKGMSNFSVRILNKTTCEIQYHEHEQDAQILKRSKSKTKIDGSGMTAQIYMSLKTESNLSKMSKETKAAVELARNSNPKNPSFLAIILNNAIRKKFMYVPSGFACRYMKGVNYSKIKVENDGIRRRRRRREWIIYCKYVWRSCRSLILQNGWSDFYNDNCLEEGDVCLFQLLHQNQPIVLKVSIFHI